MNAGNRRAKRRACSEGERAGGGGTKRQAGKDAAEAGSHAAQETCWFPQIISINFRF